MLAPVVEKPAPSQFTAERTMRREYNTRGEVVAVIYTVTNGSGHTIELRSV